MGKANKSPRLASHRCIARVYLRVRAARPQPAVVTARILECSSPRSLQLPGASLGVWRTLERLPVVRLADDGVRHGVRARSAGGATGTSLGAR